MPSDRHIELTHLATRWISNRAFKSCILPECGSVGYIADLVALAGMQSIYHERYAKYSGLETQSMSSRLKNDYEKFEGDDRWEYVIHGDIDRWYVCVFETKISRSDFLSTFGDKDSRHAKARIEPCGTAHWVVAEKGVCKPDELPDFWGLLEPYGTGLTEKKMPRLNILPEQTIHSIAFDMLWLEKNCRRSYFEQMIDMAKTVEEVHSAVVMQKPAKEILQLSEIAVKACRGFVS
ncbi:MAG: hypothetical protein PHY02_06460 [Phycisphaerae bacterium]|nr:hypothetical protein [Phycisphaerae bacterium]